MKPNELGKVMILEYHLIEPKETRWGRSVEGFRQDLNLLYKSGYRTLGMSDYVKGVIDLPAGTRPVILTFDDSSPGQFRYLVQNGKKEIDPDCAVGILIDFRKRHPDFGMAGIFFVLPGAKEPHKLFGQPEFETDKLKELVALGFEIGNHTLWHADLGKYGDATVKEQLAMAVQAVQKAVPEYKVHILALPFGTYPKDPALAVDGSYQGISYHNDAILRVAGSPAPSPFSTHRDLLRLPRIQVRGDALKTLVDHFEKRPDEVFVSDGRPDTVTFPARLQPELNSSEFKSLRVITY